MLLSELREIQTDEEFLLEFEIQHPKHLPLKSVNFERKYPGYIYRRETYDDSEYGGKGSMEMISCYSDHDGSYMGDARTARFLTKKKGLTQIQKAAPDHCVCSIGFNEKEQKWYGWSHRAICGFGIGDMLYKERFKGATDKTPFTKHGTVEIKTLAQAKQSAKNFGRSVS